METDLTDAELARRVAGGDRDAEAELCRRMGPRVEMYGLRHTRDRDVACDLAQSVLVTTLQALREGRVREPEKLASFVLGTCRMTLMDLRRRGARGQRVLEEYAREGPRGELGATAGPDLDRDQLARCVQGLPERERTIVVMSFYDERTAEDIADALGVSRGNVRVIRHRAIQRLRRCMGLEGPESQEGAAR